MSAQVAVENQQSNLPSQYHPDSKQQNRTNNTQIRIIKRPNLNNTVVENNAQGKNSRILILIE